LIAGPTASGKSQLAVDFAERLGGVIVNADSMQIYPVLRVLTARPSLADEARVCHQLYGHACLSEPYSVARWLEDVVPVLDRLLEAGQTPIFVGGTGLYFKALEEGLARVPEILPAIRADVRQSLDDAGSVALHARLQKHDPEGAARLRPSDGQRIARALEVVLSTGLPLATFQAATKANGLVSGMRLERIVLEPERPILHERINARTDRMFDEGAVEEVERLLDLNLPPEATVLRAIGVEQIGKLLRGEEDLSNTISRIKALTRQYAKRQSTWFRGQFGNAWERISTA